MTQNNNSAQLDPLDFSNVSNSELFGKLAFAYYEISVNLEIHKRFPDRSITTPHYYAKNPENSKIFSALVTEAQKRLTDNNIPLKNSISAPYYTNLDKNNTLSQQGKESLNDEQKVFSLLEAMSRLPDGKNREKNYIDIVSQLRQKSPQSESIYSRLNKTYSTYALKTNPLKRVSYTYYHNGVKTTIEEVYDSRLSTENEALKKLKDTHRVEFSPSNQERISSNQEEQAQKPTFKERLKNFGQKVKKSIIKSIQREAKDWEKRVESLKARPKKIIPRKVGIVEDYMRDLRNGHNRNLETQNARAVPNKPRTATRTMPVIQREDGGR